MVDTPKIVSAETSPPKEPNVVAESSGSNQNLSGVTNVQKNNDKTVENSKEKPTLKQPTPDTKRPETIPENIQNLSIATNVPKVDDKTIKDSQEISSLKQSKPDVNILEKSAEIPTSSTAIDSDKRPQMPVIPTRRPARKSMKTQQAQTATTSDNKTKEILNIDEKIVEAQNNIFHQNIDERKVWKIDEAYKENRLDPADLSIEDRIRISSQVIALNDLTMNIILDHSEADQKKYADLILQIDYANEEANIEWGNAHKVVELIYSTKDNSPSMRIDNIKDAIKEVERRVGIMEAYIKNMNVLVKSSEGIITKDDESVRKAKFQLWNAKYNIRKADAEIREPDDDGPQVDEEIWIAKKIISESTERVKKTREYLKSIKYIPTELVQYPITAIKLKQKHQIKNDDLITSTIQTLRHANDEIEVGLYEMIPIHDKLNGDDENWFVNKTIGDIPYEIRLIKDLLKEVKNEIESYKRAILTTENDIRDERFNEIEIRKPEDEMFDARKLLRDVENEIRKNKKINAKLSNDVQNVVQASNGYIESVKEELRNPKVRIRIAKEEMARAENWYARAVRSMSSSEEYISKSMKTSRKIEEIWKKNPTANDADFDRELSISNKQFRKGNDLIRSAKRDILHAFKAIWNIEKKLLHLSEAEGTIISPPPKKRNAAKKTVRFAETITHHIYEEPF